MHPHPRVFVARLPGQGAMHRGGDQVGFAAQAMAGPIAAFVPYQGHVVTVGERAFAATRTPEALRTEIAALRRRTNEGRDLASVHAEARAIGAAKEIRNLARSPKKLEQVAGLAEAGDGSAQLVHQATVYARLADMKASAMHAVAGALYRKDPRAIAQIKKVGEAARTPGPGQKSAQVMMSMVGACCAACAHHEDEEVEGSA